MATLFEVCYNLEKTETNHAIPHTNPLFDAWLRHLPPVFKTLRTCSYIFCVTRFLWVSLPTLPQPKYNMKLRNMIIEHMGLSSARQGEVCTFVVGTVGKDLSETLRSTCVVQCLLFILLVSAIVCVFVLSENFSRWMKDDLDPICKQCTAIITPTSAVSWRKLCIFIGIQFVPPIRIVIVIINHHHQNLSKYKPEMCTKKDCEADVAHVYHHHHHFT